MNPVDFEKDDDTNGHIDFISTAAVSINSTANMLLTKLYSCNHNAVIILMYFVYYKIVLVELVLMKMQFPLYICYL